MRVLCFFAIVVSSVAASACGEESPAPLAGPEGGQEMAHIHGLGINPADDALVIATHTGLFRAAPGADRAQRIGERRQDTMGFTVLGADEFLGSGHPDARDDLPPLLGLIRSADGGKTWDPVSLLGEVDFHVLRARGQRIYGVDAQTGVLFVSADGGRTWRREQTPGALLDLAIDPSDANRIVATGERGLTVSGNAGKSWRPISNRIVGFLAWTDAVTVVDGVGSVYQSASDLAGFRPIGRVQGDPAALATGGAELLLALHDNSVLTSSDGGRNWTTRLAASGG